MPQFKFRLLLAECHGGAAAQRRRGCEWAVSQLGSFTLQTAQARNMALSFCSSKQTFFHSLCIYLFIFLGKTSHFRKSILPQDSRWETHSWWEKARKSLFSLRVTEAGQASVTDRLLPPAHHLLVSRLWTTTSSPAVLHAQVPSGRRFLKAVRSGETPIWLRGNPTSGLPLSQTFIYLFCA